MKKRLVVMAVLFVLTMAVATQVAQAQQPMVVDIPFEFVAGNVTLPAGDYRIQKLGETSEVLLIRCSDLRTAAMLTTRGAEAKEPQAESKLVFNRYGHRYFLSQIWSAGSVRGRLLPKSQQEKEVAQVARLETKGEITLVAGLHPARP